MKVTIGLLQNEIEAAIKEYVLDRINSGYHFELGDLDIDFTVSDMDGSVSCDVTTVVKEKNKE